MKKLIFLLLYSLLSSISFANNGIAALNTSTKEELHDLGYLYLQQKKLDLAESYLKKALTQGDSSALIDLGNLYMEQNKLEKAEEYFKQATAKGYSTALCYLGYLYLSQNKITLAESYFKQAIGEEEFLIPVKGSEFFESLECRREFETEEITEAMEVAALLYLGFIYETKNNTALAVQYYQRALHKGGADATKALEALEKKQKTRVPKKYFN